MKGEKECLLLMNLLDSPFKGKKLLKKQQTACKKDMEKYLGFSRNNKEFNRWVNELIKEDCLLCVGKESRSNGGRFDVFIVNEKKTYDRLKAIPQYKNFLEFFNDRAFMKAISED